VKARRLAGDTELVQERVASNEKSRNAYFSISSSGTLVWRSGTAVLSQVTDFDRNGNRIRTAGRPVPVEIVRLAPDESHVLVSSEAGAWVMESNGPGSTSLGSVPYDVFWSSDGSGVVGVRGAEIAQWSLNGSHETRLFAGLHVLADYLALHDISADGRRILQ
jgi:hypothetical protein